MRALKALWDYKIPFLAPPRPGFEHRRWFGVAATPFILLGVVGAMLPTPSTTPASSIHCRSQLSPMSVEGSPKNASIIRYQHPNTDAITYDLSAGTMFAPRVVLDGLAQYAKDDQDQNCPGEPIPIRIEAPEGWVAVGNTRDGIDEMLMSRVSDDYRASDPKSHCSHSIDYHIDARDFGYARDGDAVGKEERMEFWIIRAGDEPALRSAIEQHMAQFCAITQPLSITDSSIDTY